MHPIDFVAEIRRMSERELEQLGQRSLREHVLAQAEVARSKYAPLDSADQLDRLLHDPDCVRHPVRLVFEFGEMAMHQFGQPDIDWRNPSEDGRVLFLRPMLRHRPELVRLAVAYLVPAVNYGDVVTDELCLAYGATLLGLTEDEFYARICALADTVGAESRPAGRDGCVRLAAPVKPAAENGGTR